MTAFFDASRGAAPSRRSVLSAMAAGCGGAILPLQASFAQSGKSLAALAADKGILFGTALGAGQAGTLTGSASDNRYLDIVRSECGVIVPENEMKIYVLSQGANAWNFAPAETIANFATSNHMKLRGHTLVWNREEYMPAWLKAADFGASPAVACEAFLRTYIAKVCDHFGDRVYSWDVVNETIDPQSGKLRETVLTKALGFDALRISFETARECAPHAQLVYNDYMSWEEGISAHRDGVLKLLEAFRAKNVPVDALGIQSHIGTDGNLRKVERKDWIRFVDEVVGMGYKILVTEFDVNDRHLPTPPPDRDAEVAAVARDYLDLMLSYRQLDQFLCWGMIDKYSWLQAFTPRDDGTPQRPTPYSSEYSPKPLRAAIAAAFAAAPKR